MTSDVDKVRQILVNLAGNAVKFTDAGEVRLELEQNGPEVRYTIRDTGIGIAREDLERLFKPFAQLDAGLTRRHGGTGLGLYISRGLAQLLGGRIEVESEPKKGSVFTLVLPADSA
jgi:signal transduction histidine kinase